jgi:hypothetical protein
VVWDAGGLTLSGLGLSDGVCVAWASCARTGTIDAGVSSTNAVTANVANDVIRQKGLTKLI